MMDRFIPFTRQASKDDISNKLALYKHGKELGLGGKLASVLPPGAPPELPDAIGNFSYLKSLDISQNNLHALTPRIAQLQGNLTELNASHNLFTDVSEIALITSLQILDLSYNSLRPAHIAPLAPLLNLKELQLSHNHLYSVSSSSSFSEESFSSETPPTSPSVSSSSPFPPSSPDLLDAEPSPRKGPLTLTLMPRHPTTIPSPSAQRPVGRRPSNPSLRSPLQSSSSPQSSPREISLAMISDNLDISLSEPSLLLDSPHRVANPEEETSINSIPLILTPASPSHNSISLSSNNTESDITDTDTPRSRSPSPSIPSPSPSPPLTPSPSPVPFARAIPLPLSHFIRLEILNLSSNKLFVFPDILGITSLIKLDLSSNKLTEVPSGIHTQLTNLREFNLQSNLLEKLPPMMKSLKKLLVEKNPLHPAFLILAQNNELLPQLQSQDQQQIFPRSSSDSAIGLTNVSPPVAVRSITPDHSTSDISPKGKNQSTSAPTTPADEHSPRKKEETPTTEAPAPIVSNNVDVRGAPDTPKKRAFSLPQSPVRGLILPQSPNGLRASTASFGSPPPAPLIFPASPPPQGGPSSNEIFVTRIKSRSLDPDDLQAALRDFVHNTYTTLVAHPVWRKSASIDLQEAELHLQEYVLEHLYDHIFAARQEDQEKDKEVANHIKRCYFITPEHLDISVLRQHEDIWRRAEQQLLQINSTRSVRSKMRCVVRMCRDLISALARAQGDSLGADVLLPHLIFVILQANPPYLHSNIVYMTRFSESEASETIYYVTQLVAALYFIEHIEASSLNIDPEYFHQRMNEQSRSSSSAATAAAASASASASASAASAAASVPGDAPAPSRSRMLRSSGSAFVNLDGGTLAKIIDTKRKEFATLSAAESAKWMTENDALINQCVGLSREVLPALPTSSPFHPLAPAPRFEGVSLDNLRAVDIPHLLEDYHRLVALLHLHRPSSALFSPPLSSLSPTFINCSSPSMLSSSSSTIIHTPSTPTLSSSSASTSSPIPSPSSSPTLPSPSPTSISPVNAPSLSAESRE